VQRRRDKAAAVKLMRKLLKKQGFAPEVPVTDKQRSCGVAKSEIGLSVRHEHGLRMNNRAENSHQPTRRRAREMQGFKSPGSAQRLLSIHAAVDNTFNVQRHPTSRRTGDISPGRTLTGVKFSSKLAQRAQRKCPGVSEGPLHDAAQSRRQSA
jgi:transposase-like protein